MNQEITPKSNSDVIIASGHQVLHQQSKGIEELCASIDINFVQIVHSILSMKGKLVLSGVGKSGIVARKIAATLSSTGTPALYLHPTEATHGDLGVLSAEDIVMLLSNSGETRELSAIIHYCKRFAIPLIGLTRNPGSTLYCACDIKVALPAVAEASLLGAPTTSSTMMMVYGDALAVALYRQRNFSQADYMILHPGGKIGAQLQHLHQLMHVGGDMPLVHLKCPMPQAIIEISTKRFGCVGVIDENGVLVGIISDGDLRRNISEDLRTKVAAELMNAHPKTSKSDVFAAEALQIMQTSKITQVFVVDDSGVPVGIVHVHDLIKLGVI